MFFLKYIQERFKSVNSGKIYLLSVFLIFFIAFLIRIQGIDWDDGKAFHPDERSIYMQVFCMKQVVLEEPNYEDCLHDKVNVKPGFPGLLTFLDKDESPLNPQWFPIGTFLLYLLLIIEIIIGKFQEINVFDVRIIARAITVFIDSLTVIIIYQLGKELYSRNVGLLAGFMLAISPMSIQISHFYRPESFLFFFSTLVILLLIRLYKQRTIKQWIILGVVLGLILSIKTSLISLMIPCISTFVFIFFTQIRSQNNQFSMKEFWDFSKGLGLCSLVTLVTFFLLMPYAFIDFQTFFQQNSNETTIAKIAGLMPYTLQYMGTTSVIYEWRQFIIWGVGLPFGIVCLFSFIYNLFLNFKKPVFIRSLLLIFIISHIILLAFFEVKFFRYIYPIIPIIVLFGAAGLIKLSSLSIKKFHLKYIGLIISGVVVLYTLIFSFAFQRIYQNQHPAIVASNWFKETVSKDQTIITDNHWDEGIPDLFEYNVKQIPIYDVDNSRKTKMLASLLNEGDYIVFYSNRTYGSVTRAPWKYPMSSRYYKLLFNEKLGFEITKIFTNYPEIFGFNFIDDPFKRVGFERPSNTVFHSELKHVLNLGYADGNIINYDHPTVIVFSKTKQLSFEELHEKLVPGLNDIYPIQNELFLSNENILKLESEMSQFPLQNLRSHIYSILYWILIIQVLSLLAFPLIFICCRGLFDRGYGLSKLIGLFCLAYISWVTTSVFKVEFTSQLIFFSLSFFALVSGTLFYFYRNELFKFIRNRWKLILCMESVFFLIFFIGILFKYVNPDLWHPFRGGEKPMDLSYFTAVIRSPFMPPYDPWYAQGQMNYYYWGFVLLGTVAKIVTAIPSVSYNIAGAILYGILGITTFSVVFNLIHITSFSNFIKKKYSDVQSSKYIWRKSLIGGLFGVLFVCFLGNLDGVIQIIKWSFDYFLNITGSFSFDYWKSSRIIENLENIPANLLRFWIPQRDYVDISPHITEFPYFSFLFGDLHAHVISMPIAVTVLGLIMNLFILLKNNYLKASLIGTIVLGVLLGSLLATNLWEGPTYFFISLIVIVCGIHYWKVALFQKIQLIIGFISLLVGISIFAYLPFWINIVTFGSVIDLSLWRTPLNDYLVIFSPFLICIFAYILFTIRNTININISFKNLINRKEILSLKSRKLIIFIFLMGIILFLLLSGYNTVLFLFVLVVFMGILSYLLSLWNKEQFFIMILVFTGVCLSIFVEFFRFGDDIGRMNTVFKIYLQVWIIFAIAAAYCLSNIIYTFNEKHSKKAKNIILIICSLFILGGLVYPMVGTSYRLKDRFDTSFQSIDGTKFMENTTHFEQGKPITLKWDLMAIQWLNKEIKTIPVVLEAHTEPYRWGGRISTYTGMPTVLGWEWHQIQQRNINQNAVKTRSEIITTLYNTSDPVLKKSLLNKFRVGLIVVGTLERILYDSEGLETFHEMSDFGVEKIYQNDEVEIFQVRH